MGPRFVKVNGVDLALWERPGFEPAILLSHATGLHGRCWDATTDRITGRRLIAIDHRGHGQSTKVPPPVAWRTFGYDVAALVRALELRGAIGVGHSMGGHSIALAAALVPSAFSRLLLLDPVIYPPEAYTGALTQPHFARKRRERWSSWEEMFERYRPRVPFDTWDERVLRDYCQYGLVHATDGDGWMLACAPEVEGSIYEQSLARESDIYAEIATVRIPVSIIRSPKPVFSGSKMDMTGSATPADLASKFAHGEDRVVTGTHFFPMESPEFIADQIERLLSSK